MQIFKYLEWLRRKQNEAFTDSPLQVLYVPSLMTLRSEYHIINNNLLYPHDNSQITIRIMFKSMIPNGQTQ